MTTEKDGSDAFAIATLVDSYKFDLDKKEHKEVLKSLVKIAEKRVESVPTEKKQHDSHNRLMALIGVLAAVVTISFMIWVNHLNHNENVQLEEQRITQKAH